MSELSAVQVPKPRDEQAFERCSLVLWRHVLNDKSALLYGRRGQKQHGVDIVGFRNGNPNHPVGVQCRLKGDGQLLSEKEIRTEVDKAISFHPPLSEYIIATTAPDDVNLQSLAMELSASVSRGRSSPLLISVLGWDSLQLEIQRHPEALKAFDPSHTPQGDKIIQAIDDVPDIIDAKISSQLEMFRKDLATFTTEQVTVEAATTHPEYEELIDSYVALIPNDPNIALESLQRLQTKVESNISSRIHFRIAANIAVCRLELGELERAAREFIAASEIAPDEPKAISNKAFAHLLLDDWGAARDIAKEGLVEQPGNASLAAIYIRSLIHDHNVEEPISLVPAQIRTAPEVEEAHVAWLMQRAKPELWWEAALGAHRRHPEVAELRELHAGALLSRAIGGERYVYGQLIHEDGYSDIETSIQVYESLWGEIRGRARRQRSDSSSVPLNLIIAYRIVGRKDSAIALGWEAAEIFPEDATVKEYLASLLVDEGETEEALQLVADLEDNEQVLAVRYKSAVLSKDWETVLGLADRYAAQVPTSEQPVAEALKVVARLELEAPEEARRILETEHGKFLGDPRASILLSKSARTSGWEDLSQSLFDAAATSVEDEGVESPSRLAIAEEAILRGQPSAAIAALHGRVALDRESEGLALLAHAMVLDVPIRDRAIKFFDDLAAGAIGAALFQKLQGILHFNRGAPDAAIEPLSSALRADPRIDTFLFLIRAYYLSNRKEAIRELVRPGQVETLEGTARERINVSQVLLDFSDPARALRHAYFCVTEGLDNAEVVMKFIGLVIRATSCGWNPREDADVSPGTWVRLAGPKGDGFEALIDEAQDRPWGQAVQASNGFISRCLGLREGAEFQVENPLGSLEKWTVAEIKPSWLQAFHHLIAGFGQRFPEATGFAKINISDDDIEPALEQVRRHSAMAREQADVYLRNNLPLVMAAGNRPGGVVGFGEYISSIGEQIRVCTGAAEEREEALEIIQKNGQAGALVDAFTAWHAAALGVLPVLTERVGKISIPANELAQLRALGEEWTGGDEGDSMSLMYRDGQYMRFVETAEDRRRRKDRLHELVAVVEGSCVVEPLQFPDRLSELGEKLTRLPPTGAFAAAAMAGQSRMLVCEDIVMRRLARDGFGAKGVWLQAVLFDAAQAGAMSVNAYADSVVYLAHFRHAYVSVSGQVLLSVFERDGSRDFSQLEVLCSFIGDENAESHSHTAIAAEFVNAIWAMSQPLVVADEFPADSKTRKATNLIIRALLEKRREGDWARWAAQLYRNLDTMPRQYLLRWCEENFLLVGQLLASLGRKED